MAGIAVAVAGHDAAVAVLAGAGPSAGLGADTSLALALLWRGALRCGCGSAVSTQTRRKPTLNLLEHATSRLYTSLDVSPASAAGLIIAEAMPDVCSVCELLYPLITPQVWTE